MRLPEQKTPTYSDSYSRREFTENSTTSKKFTKISAEMFHKIFIETTYIRLPIDYLKNVR